MEKKIRVLVNGAMGRMGSEAVKAVTNAPDMELIGGTDIGDNLQEKLEFLKPDVVVDFTHPSSVYNNVKTIINSGSGGVIGTTGFSPEQISTLAKDCQSRKPAILIAPNFAIGALLMMHCAQVIAKYMPEVEIVELHHAAKADAPSGTAVKTAELIAEVREKDFVPRGTYEPGARGGLFGGIPIHSIRLPGFLAHQEVIFGGEGQTLSLRHDSINRTCFMPGVLLGIREVHKRQGLIYGLDRILFEQ